jgi:signal peptidase I
LASFRPTNAARYTDTGTAPSATLAVPYGVRVRTPYVRMLRLFSGFLGLVATALLLRIFVVAPFGIPSESMLPRLMVGDYIIVTKWNYGYSKHSVPFQNALGEGRIWAQTPKRGDVVVFKAPPKGQRDFVKRVIGLPGDRIQVRGGRLFINGHELNRVQMDDFVTPATPAMRASAKREGNPNPCFQPDFGEKKDGGTQCRYPQFRELIPPHRAYATLDLYPALDIDNTKVFHVPQGQLFLMGDNRDRSADSRLPAKEGGAIGMVPIDNVTGRAAIVAFSVDGSATWYNPKSWLTAVRWDRIGGAI